jgi:hypothetical protein
MTLKTRGRKVDVGSWRILLQKSVEMNLGEADP